jgi:hypothetical protein
MAVAMMLRDVVTPVEETAALLGMSKAGVSLCVQRGTFRVSADGQVFIDHAMSYRTGADYLGAERRRDLSPDAIAAVGWLANYRSAPITDADLRVFHQAAARWGLSRDQADGLLTEATAVLGPWAPRFEAGASDALED